LVRRRLLSRGTGKTFRRNTKALDAKRSTISERDSNPKRGQPIVGCDFHAGSGFDGDQVGGFAHPLVKSGVGAWGSAQMQARGNGLERQRRLPAESWRDGHFGGSPGRLRAGS